MINLHLVRRIADRIVVMYLGEMVESVTRDELQAGLAHPYSKALFAAAPVLDRRADAMRSLPEPAIKGEVPSPINLPSGCRFHPRCPLRQPICETDVPALEVVDGCDIRCHFASELRTRRNL